MKSQTYMRFILKIKEKCLELDVHSLCYALRFHQQKTQKTHIALMKYDLKPSYILVIK